MNEEISTSGTGLGSATLAQAFWPKGQAR